MSSLWERIYDKMKNIKFRGFFEGRMFEVEKINFYLGTVEFKGSLGIYEIEELHNPLMQFTGLQDKAGREIYEGDIVRGSVKGGKVRISEVKYWVNYGIFGLNHKSYCGGNDNTRPNGSTGSSTPYRPYTWKSYKSLEVIGNIYENKELMNV